MQQKRPIRSFVRREGRMTPAQQKALVTLWPKYGVQWSTDKLDLDAIFGRSADKILEIGFGMGEAVIKMAQASPEQDFLAIDVHKPGIGSLLLNIEKYQLDNIRVLEGDVVELLTNCIANQCLSTCLIFFADPWPKKRHHKRRLIQTTFVELLVTKLKTGGILHLATDWQNYAEHMLLTLEKIANLENAIRPGEYAPRPEYRPLTKFEQRGQRLGHGVWDLIYRKVQ